MIDKIGFYLAIFTLGGLFLISGYFGIKSGKFLSKKMEEATQTPVHPDIALGGGGSKTYSYKKAAPAAPVPTPTPQVIYKSDNISYPENFLEQQKFYVKVGFSAIVLIASLFVVIKGGNTDSIKWAFGSVGTILGYWLK